MKQAPFTSKRWRRVEYDRLVDVGAFEGEPIELIGGQLIVAEPQHSPHAGADRAQKGSLYARAGIADYWIVNLVDHVVEVHRGPDLTAPFGWRYSSVERVRPPATLTVLELPQAAVPVAALLP